MTDKEIARIKLTASIIIFLIAGMFIGAIIVSLRYNTEIRADQIELQGQVEEIAKDKAAIKDAIDMLLFQVEQLKKERQELRELRLTLSKGE